MSSLLTAIESYPRDIPSRSAIPCPSHSSTDPHAPNLRAGGQVHSGTGRNGDFPRCFSLRMRMQLDFVSLEKERRGRTSACRSAVAPREEWWTGGSAGERGAQSRPDGAEPEGISLLVSSVPVYFCDVTCPASRKLSVPCQEKVSIYGLLYAALISR